jgi:GPN-loop GTPase
LDLSDTDSIDKVMSHVDYTMQYGEDEEPKEVEIPDLYFDLGLPFSSQPKDMDKGDFAEME